MSQQDKLNKAGRGRKEVKQIGGKKYVERFYFKGKE